MKQNLKAVALSDSKIDFNLNFFLQKDREIVKSVVKSVVRCS